jgi:hypothetical protein
LESQSLIHTPFSIICDTQNQPKKTLSFLLVSEQNFSIARQAQE